MGTKELRLFLAIQINQEVINKIEQFVKPIQKEFPKLKWVAIQNIHITLKFLGNVEITKIHLLKKSLENIKIPSFNLMIKNTGCFPNSSKPRVLWIGVENPDNNLKSLYNQIETTLQALNYPKESKPFEPHLTLARIKDNPHKSFSDIITRHQSVYLGESTVNHFDLMESTLTPKGAIYKTLFQFQLV